MTNQVIDVNPLESESMAAIVPASSIEVEYVPPRIVDNIDAVEAYIDEQLAPFQGAVLDPADGEQVKQGRKFMADLNKLKKPIEAERKRIKAEYEKPLKAFEARVKQITAKIDAARDNIKQQVDAADAEFREMRRAMLADEYAGCAGALADVIPADAVIEESWLNRSTTERKAVDALGEKMMRALDGYNTLQAKQLAHKTEVVKLYCETLDLMAAMQLEDELNERDRERAEFEERQRQAEAVAAERRAAEERAMREEARQAAERFAAEMHEQRAATEAEAFEQPAAPRTFVWALSMEFTGTREFAQTIADLLARNGLAGATIECRREIHV